MSEAIAKELVKLAEQVLAEGPDSAQIPNIVRKVVGQAQESFEATCFKHDVPEEIVTRMAYGPNNPFIKFGGELVTALEKELGT